LGHAVGKLVVFYSAPHVEQKRAAGAQNPPGLCEGCRLVRKEHRAELAHHDVEGFIAKRQMHRICLPPGDRPRRADTHRVIEHRLIQVGCHDGYMVRQPSRHATGDNASACSDLQHG